MKIEKITPSRGEHEFIRFDVLVSGVVSQIIARHKLMALYPHYSDPVSKLFDSREEFKQIDDEMWLFTQITPIRK